MRINCLLLEVVTIIFFVALLTEAGQYLDLKNDYLKTSIFDKFPSLTSYITVPAVTQVGGPVLYKPPRKPAKKTKEQEQDEKLLPDFKSSIPAVPSAYKELLGHHWNPYEAEKIALALQQEQEALSEAQAQANAEAPSGSLLSKLWNWKQYQKDRVRHTLVRHELKKAAQHSKQHKILKQYHMQGVQDVYRPPVGSGWGENGNNKKKNKKIFKQQKKKLKEKKKKQKKQQKKQKKRNKKKGGGIGIQSLGSVAASPGAGGWGDPYAGRPINRVPGSSNIPFAGGGSIPGLGGGIPGLGTIPGLGRTSNNNNKHNKQNNAPQAHSGLHPIPGYSRVKEEKEQEFGGLNPLPGYGSLANMGEIAGFDKILGGSKSSYSQTYNSYSRWKGDHGSGIGTGDAPAGGRDDFEGRFRNRIENMKEIQLRNRARGPAKEFSQRILQVEDENDGEVKGSMENGSNSVESTEYSDSNIPGSIENTGDSSPVTSSIELEYNTDSNENSFDEVYYSPVPQGDYTSSSEYYYDQNLAPNIFHYAPTSIQPSYRLLPYDEFV